MDVEIRACKERTKMCVGGVNCNCQIVKVLDTFRNEAGQPTNTRKSIGKLDPDGKLIPNDAYWEFYTDTSVASDLVVSNTIPSFDSCTFYRGYFSHRTDIGVTQKSHDLNFC